MNILVDRTPQVDFWFAVGDFQQKNLKGSMFWEVGVVASQKHRDSDETRDKLSDFLVSKPDHGTLVGTTSQNLIEHFPLQLCN